MPCVGVILTLHATCEKQFAMSLGRDAASGKSLNCGAAMLINLGCAADDRVARYRQTPSFAACFAGVALRH